MLEKGIRKLQQTGITRAVLTNTLKTVLSPNIRLNDFLVFDGSMMFFDFVPKMTQWLCERYELKPPNIKIEIREKKLSFIGKSLVEKLCYQSKYMRLTTTDIFAAKRFADLTLEQLGFIIDVQNSADIAEDFGDIVVNVDEIYVSVPQKSEKIVGFTIDNIKVPQDTDMFDILACLGIKHNEINISKWICEDKNIDITA